MNVEAEEYQESLDKLYNSLCEVHNRDHAMDIIQQIDDLLESLPELMQTVVQAGVKVYASKST